MDEQNKPITQQATANVPDYSPEINAMYDAQRASQQQQLESAYNQNLSTLQQGKQDIAGVYNTQANDLATQYERTRRNNNFRADLNGLNTGTASQMDLAQQSNYMKGYGQLRASQAAAERQADRDIANLEIQYKNAVAQALAENDYQRATDLLKEHQRRDAAAQEESRYQYQINQAEQQYADKMAQQALENQRYEESWAQTLKQYEDTLAQRQLENQRYDTEYANQQQQRAEQQALNDAKQKAAYGDFSGYAALYGQETANAMQQYWLYANPDYAYANGMISADQYAQYTGYYPSATSYSGGSSGGSSYRSYSSGGRSGGSGGGGGGSGGGVNDADNGSGGNVGELSDYDKYLNDRASYLQEKATYGNAGLTDRAIYADDVRTMNLQAKAYAEQAAAARGLTPGTTAYNDFVSEVKGDILASNAQYIEAQNALGAIGEAERLEEQKKQAAFEAQYGKAGSVSYDYNAELSGKKAEEAFASASTYSPAPTTQKSNSNVTSASSQSGNEIRAKGSSGGTTITNKKVNKTK